MANSLAEFAGAGPLLAVAFVAAVLLVITAVGSAIAARAFSAPEKGHNGRQYFD